MASRGSSLSDLAATLPARLVGDGDVVVSEVTHDSRRAGHGWIYVALTGQRHDGHDYVAEAVGNGALAVCLSHPVETTVPSLLVDDTRLAIGPLSSTVYGNPSAALDVIGVTGTNGKTTVTHFIESIAHSAGLTTGLIGTIHTRYAGKSVQATLTTPEAPDLQKLLADMRDNGVTLVAAEVSSHALELARVKGTSFAVAAFTNLSQDHLDFHGDMAAYRAAKERLFSEYAVGTAVINIDDPVGEELAARYEGEILTVGSTGDVSIRDRRPEPGGTSLHIETPAGGVTALVPVVGEFNLSNLAMAVACCIGAGIEFAPIAGNLANLERVPGRFEVVSGDDAIVVIVDFAHTPEAVVRAIEAGRELSRGRVIALLGAGGDRDRAKRPAMGEALSTADLAVVTSDNPRSEEPEAIVSALLSGVHPGRERIVEVDRRRAIALAIEAADDGDVVLVLGRGHEPNQTVGTEKIPFDDRQVAAETLAAHRKSAATGFESGSITP